MLNGFMSSHFDSETNLFKDSLVNLMLGPNVSIYILLDNGLP